MEINFENFLMLFSFQTPSLEMHSAHSQKKGHYQSQSGRRKINFARAFSFQIYFARVRLKYTRPLYSTEIDNNPFFGAHSQEKGSFYKIHFAARF